MAVKSVFDLPLDRETVRYWQSGVPADKPIDRQTARRYISIVKNYCKHTLGHLLSAEYTTGAKHLRSYNYCKV